MKNLLYIGNNLNTSKANPSTIQVLGERLRTEGYMIKLASSYSNKLRRLIDMLWVCLRFSKWADIVLIDTYSTQNFYYAFLSSQLCRILRVPYIPILHGGNLPNRLKNSPTLSSMIFRHSKTNVAPSKFIQSVFENSNYKVDYIPNCITIEDYEVEEKDFEVIRLLWVRSFSEIYNPELAVRVYKQLLDLGYPTELCMVGPDTDGSLLKTKALAETLDLQPKFTGKLTKNEWISISKQYNVFINTTNFDNMPVSVIEAMALGFPIVSTNVGGMPNLIKDKINGLLVPPNTVDVMTDAIITIFKEKSLRVALGNNARITAERFSWFKIKNQWNAILK